MIIRYNTKEAFVLALEETRKGWKKYDEDQKKKHKLAEERYMGAFKKALEVASKWSYEEAKKHNFNLQIDTKKYGWGAPSCPYSMEHALDVVLATINRTGQTRFNIGSTGSWSMAHRLLSFNFPERKDMCE